MREVSQASRSSRQSSLFVSRHRASRSGRLWATANGRAVPRRRACVSHERHHSDAHTHDPFREHISQGPLFFVGKGRSPFFTNAVRRKRARLIRGTFSLVFSLRSAFRFGLSQESVGLHPTAIFRAFGRRRRFGLGTAFWNHKST